MELAVDVYKVSGKLPDEDKYNLSQQIRKCSISIPSNIAEGAGRNSDKEFNHFLGIAKGSSFELQTQLTLITRLDLLPSEEIGKVNDQVEEIGKMISGFQNHLTSII